MKVLERIGPALGDLAARSTTSQEGTLVLEIEAKDAHEAVQRLRDACGFETCTFVTAVDRFPMEPRFEVSWQLHSLQHNERVRVRARVPGSAARVPTVVDLYPGDGSPPGGPKTEGQATGARGCVDEGVGRHAPSLRSRCCSWGASPSGS